MRRYPKAIIYIWCTIAVGLVILVHTAAAFGFPVGYSHRFLVLFSLTAASRFFPIKVTDTTSYVVGKVFVFAALYLLPLSWSLLMCFLSWVPVIPKRVRAKGPSEALFCVYNGCVLVVLTFVSDIVLNAFGPKNLVVRNGWWALACASIAFSVLQRLLIATKDHLQTGKPLIEIGYQITNLDSFIVDLSLPFSGGLLVLTWESPLRTAAFGLVLFIISYRAFSLATTSRMSERDSRTGLYNHVYFQRRLRQTIAQASRTCQEVSLIFTDLDNFRLINNRFGHQTGDLVLHAFAQVFESSTPVGAICARYGGEEFVMLLPHTGCKEATLVAEKIRTSVERLSVLPHNQESGPVSITVSCGVASFPKDARTPEALLEAADREVIRAKTAGKNRVLASR